MSCRRIINITSYIAALQATPNESSSQSSPRTSSNPGDSTTTYADSSDTPLLISKEEPPLKHFVEEEDLEAKKFVTKGFKSKRARWIWFGAISSIFIILFISLITSYFTFQRTDITSEQAKQKYADTIYGRIRIRSLDISTKSATGEVLFTMGENLKKKLNNRNLTFTLQGSEDMEWDGSEVRAPYIESKKGNIKFYAGSPRNYPFDSYGWDLKATVKLPDNSTVKVTYFFDNSVLLYRTQIKADKKQGGSKIIITRSATTVVIAVLAMVILWGFAVSYTLLAIKVMFFKRPVVVLDIDLGALLLFNVPSIRKMMPGVPDLGVFSDFVSVLWCLALISLSLLTIILAGWVRDLYTHEKTKINDVSPNTETSLPPFDPKYTLSVPLEQDRLLNDYEFGPTDSTQISAQTNNKLVYISNEKMEGGSIYHEMQEINESNGSLLSVRLNSINETKKEEEHIQALLESRVQESYNLQLAN